MANITVSVPDEVYDAARVKAAESRTSVSAMVREFLIRVAAQGSEFRRLVEMQEQVLDAIQAGAGGLSASQRLTRSDVHDRDALR
jgi:plasmid stability protein